MRNGDILAFNARIVHCVSSQRNGQREGHSMSLCSNAGLAGGNNGDAEVEGDLVHAESKLKLVMLGMRKRESD